jgi:hypothetical protein
MEQITVGCETGEWPKVGSVILFSSLIRFALLLGSAAQAFCIFACQSGVRKSHYRVVTLGLG